MDRHREAGSHLPLSVTLQSPPTPNKFQPNFRASSGDSFNSCSFASPSPGASSLLPVLHTGSSWIQQSVSTTQDALWGSIYPRSLRYNPSPATPVHFARGSVHHGSAPWPQVIKASYPSPSLPCDLYLSTDPHPQAWQSPGPLPLPTLQSSSLRNSKGEDPRL